MHIDPLIIVRLIDLTIGLAGAACAISAIGMATRRYDQWRQTRSNRQLRQRIYQHTAGRPYDDKAAA